MGTREGIMKRKLFITAVISLSSVVFGIQLPAQGAIVKTTVAVITPTYIFAGVANPIDVSVCPKSSSSATTCTASGERTVSLYANNRKVLTAKTTGGGGIAQFKWIPTSSGKITLKAVVNASGSSRSLTSEPKSVTVRARVSSTSIGTWSCGSVCVSGIPGVLNLAQEQTITAGLISGVPKSRKVRFQTLRTNNRFEDEVNGISVWQDELGKYGFTVNLADVSGTSDCPAGDTLTWNFRFFVDATSKSPASATASKWIDLKCAGTPVDEEVTIDVDYQDQFVDYASYYPDDIFVSVTAAESTQYSIGSEFCSTSSDCEDSANWYSMEYYSKDDNIFGGGTFSLSADPLDYGQYYVRVVVINWANSDMFYSEWYTLNLN